MHCVIWKPTQAKVNGAICSVREDDDNYTTSV